MPKALHGLFADSSRDSRRPRRSAVQVRRPLRARCATALRSRVRARYVPVRRVPKEDSWAVAGSHSPALTWAGAVHEIVARNFSNWLRGFDSRRPLQRKSPGHLTRERLGIRYSSGLSGMVPDGKGRTTQDRTRLGRRSIAESSCSQIKPAARSRSRRRLGGLVALPPVAPALPARDVGRPARKARRAGAAEPREVTRPRRIDAGTPAVAPIGLTRGELGSTPDRGQAYEPPPPCEIRRSVRRVAAACHRFRPLCRRNRARRFSLVEPGDAGAFSGWRAHTRQCVERPGMSA